MVGVIPGLTGKDSSKIIASQTNGIAISIIPKTFRRKKWTICYIFIICKILRQIATIEKISWIRKYYDNSTTVPLICWFPPVTTPIH